MKSGRFESALRVARLQTAQKLEAKAKQGLPLLLQEVERDEQLKEVFISEPEKAWALELEDGASGGN
ncbi:MAG: hypothetical protein ACXQS4_00370 [Methermicoccaceae archaeon]